MLLALLFCLCLFLAAYGLTKIQRRKHGHGALPPGPPGLPFLGNALQIPLAHSWLAFTEWAQQYGASPPRCAFPRRV